MSSETKNQINRARRPVLPRRPHTAFMGLMGLALLALSSWAFVREVTFVPGAQPSIARHLPFPRAPGSQQHRGG
jgi:hypothetical protein